MSHIIVCCAQKGGCAKTVTVHNLSAALCRMGKRVLAVDFDSQASLTACFGLSDRDLPMNIAHLMELEAKDMDMPAGFPYIQHCAGIDLIPSGSMLSAVSEMMHQEIGCEQFLSNILSPLKDDYDYIIIDTGPKLDNLSINAMIAADQLLIPVNPQYLSTVGLQPLLRTYSKIRRRFNPNLEVAGILLTMCEHRTNLCKIISEQLREDCTGTVPVFDAAIPMTVKVGEAVYYSRSVLDYAPKSNAFIAYQRFAKELVDKLERSQRTVPHPGRTYAARIINYNQNRQLKEVN